MPWRVPGVIYADGLKIRHHWEPWEVQTSLHDTAIVRTANEIQHNSQGAGSKRASMMLGALKVASNQGAPIHYIYIIYVIDVIGLHRKQGTGREALFFVPTL